MRLFPNNLINIVATLFLFVALANLSGCKPKYTDVKLHKVECCDISDAVDGKLTIGFGLDIENPNQFPITVKDINVKVKVNGIEVGKAGADKKVKLLKRTRKTYKLHVTADIKKVLVGSLANLGALLGGGKKSMDAEIEGEIKASAMGITKTIPVEGKYPIKIK